MKSFRFRCFVALLLTIVVCSPTFSQTKPVRTFSRPDQTCPPAGLANLYQWDDGKGNDLAVEEICVDGSYFSLRVSQSLNGHYTTVATPTGTSGTTTTGEC